MQLHARARTDYRSIDIQLEETQCVERSRRRLVYERRVLVAAIRSLHSHPHDDFFRFFHVKVVTGAPQCGVKLQSTSEIFASFKKNWMIFFRGPSSTFTRTSSIAASFPLANASRAAAIPSNSIIWMISRGISAKSTQAVKRSRYVSGFPHADYGRIHNNRYLKRKLPRQTLLPAAPVRSLHGHGGNAGGRSGGRRFFGMKPYPDYVRKSDVNQVEIHEMLPPWAMEIANGFESIVMLHIPRKGAPCGYTESTSDCGIVRNISKRANRPGPHRPGLIISAISPDNSMH